VSSAPPPKSLGDLILEIARVLYLYVRGQIIIAAIVTALYLVGFAILQVPLWFPIALACGALNLIPRIGSLIALLLVVFAAWIGGGDMTRLIEVLAVWVVVQTLEGFVITPRLLGRPLGLRPLAVFAAILVGSLLFGPIGFFLAVPAVAVVNVIWKFVRRPSEQT
jgi:predicted PurR-regulated permease PerM